MNRIYWIIKTAKGANVFVHEYHKPFSESRCDFCETVYLFSVKTTAATATRNGVVKQKV